MMTVKTNKMSIGITLVSIGALLNLSLGMSLYVGEYKFHFMILGLLCSIIGVTLIIMKRIEDKEVKKLYPAFIAGGLIITMLVVYLFMFNSSMLKI